MLTGASNGMPDPPLQVCTATTPPPVSPTRPPTDPPTNPAPPTAPPAVGVPTQSPTTMDQANCVKFRDWPLEVLGNHTAAQCHTVTAQDTADSKAYCLSSKYTSDLALAVHPEPV